MRLRQLLFLAGSLAFISGCVSSPKPSSPANVVAALGPVPASSSLGRVSTDSWPALFDDSDTPSLRQALEQSASYYLSLPPSQRFRLAGDTYTARDLAESTIYFDSLVRELSPGTTAFQLAVHENFVLYQSTGADRKGTVTFSSYYEPTMPARLTRDSSYRFPMYGRPKDLVDVNLGLFDVNYQGARIAGRQVDHSLIPYFTRADIDSKGTLNKKGLEIAWAKDPLDIFFMQIEGSGWLDLGAGQLTRIRYDGDNGRPYRSAGLYLISKGKVKAQGFNHDRFKSYMDTHPTERQQILNVDERYIFFRLDTSSAAAFAFGDIDVPLTPGRSIATDPKIFPKGMLGWIDVPKTAMGPIRRFVLSQDEGGAIQGPGRVDFFAGSGSAAEKFATHLWDTGRLYFLVKKKIMTSEQREKE